MYEPLQVSGFALAGGRSSRMGRNKALLELAGKPLVEHALTKLRRVCCESAVLSNDLRVMEPFGRVVVDLHTGCGPMGGMEAALVTAKFEWSLVLPVDVPFVPTVLLYRWAQVTVAHGKRFGTRVAVFRVGGVLQPALLMLHREMAPFVTEALVNGEFKLAPVLQMGAEELARRNGLKAGDVLKEWPPKFSTAGGEPAGPAWSALTREQEERPDLFFANVNTPEEFALAELHANLLDTQASCIE